jgi:hypothetical protein
MKRKGSYYLISVLIVFFSCKPNTQNISYESDTTGSQKSFDSIVIEEGGIPIFYNMYLSVEMSTLFKSIGATYNVQILNAPERIDSYETSTDKALNLGVYAVDLSYSKYFDQFEQAGKYLKNMHKLATDLGIPDDKFVTSVKRIEKNLTNKDSLIKIANELYVSTESYLKENERASAAALIIAGGWVEALHIATNMINKKKNDIDLIERISEQKFSLENLIALLKIYEEELVVSDLLIKLNDLRTSFIPFKPNEKDMEDTYKQLDEIKLKIESLRKEIIS